eukprot:scaffold17.g556.t1
MSTLTTYFSKALGKQTVRQAWAAGGWKVLIDGTLAEACIEHGPGGELVGVDQNGNRYFEKKDAQMVRNRWVVYAGAADHWREQEASTVPPEWHGWLHYITDECPANATFPRPIYSSPEHRANATMTPEHYLPKAWTPPKSS